MVILLVWIEFLSAYRKNAIIVLTFFLQQGTGVNEKGKVNLTSSEVVKALLSSSFFGTYKSVVVFTPCFDLEVIIQEHK